MRHDLVASEAGSERRVPRFATCATTSSRASEPNSEVRHVRHDLVASVGAEVRHVRHDLVASRRARPRFATCATIPSRADVRSRG